MHARREAVKLAHLLANDIRINGELDGEIFIRMAAAREELKLDVG
jgi:hypothetical protein